MDTALAERAIGREGVEAMGGPWEFTPASTSQRAPLVAAMKTFTNNFATFVQHRTWINVPMSDVHIVLITLYALTHWLGL